MTHRLEITWSLSTAEQERLFVEAYKLAVNNAFIEDMSAGQRHVVAVDAPALADAQSAVLRSAVALRAGDFTARPEKSKCKFCDVQLICSATAH